MAALTGGLSLLGSTGPTEEERRRLYNEQHGALLGSIGLAQADARRQAMGSATTAMGGGNPFLAGRLGAQAGGDAAERIGSQGVVQQAQLQAQQTAAEMQARNQQGQAAQQRIGALLGAGGQVLGMAVPAFGALRGAAGATGVTGSLSGSGNPLGGMLGGLLGGGGPQQQAQPPQAPTPQVGIGQGGFSSFGPSSPGFGLGMQWDAINNRWVPVDPR